MSQNKQSCSRHLKKCANFLLLCLCLYINSKTAWIKYIYKVYFGQNTESNEKV